MRRLDVLIGVTGALLIATALFGLIVIEQRAGPFDHTLVPIPLGGTVAGSVTSSPAVVPDAQSAADCALPPPVEPCTPARTAVTLQITGLPDGGTGLHYIAFLRGVEGVLALGALGPASGTYALEYDEPVDSAGYAELLVSAHPAAGDTEPSALVLHRAAIGSGPGRDVDLAATLGPIFPRASGSLRLSQSGAVTVSVLAAAEIRGIGPVEGFTYTAWLVQEDDDDPVRLGTLSFVAADTAILDARVERVDLARQGTFLVTIAPVQGTGAVSVVAAEL